MQGAGKSIARWGLPMLIFGVLAGCAPVEHRENAAHLQSRDTEVVILSDAAPEHYDFAFIVSTPDGDRASGQMFTDGRRTYLIWPRRDPIKGLQTAHGERVDIRREGPYWVVPRRELLWFVETERGHRFCVRAQTLDAGVCRTQESEADRTGPPAHELLETREELQARLQQLLLLQEQEPTEHLEQ